MLNIGQIAILIGGALAIGLLVVFVFQLKARVNRLEKRFSKTLGGSKSAASIEATLVNYFDKLNLTAEQLDRIRSEYQHLNTLAGGSFQKLGLVRFNPFRDTGGDQSFALCLLDSQDCGIMLTAVHGREGTRIYAKPIQYGQGQGALSTEEKAALRQARGPASTKKKS